MNAETKIYIADLAAYNDGILHGVWIDAAQDMEDIQNQINQMLSQSPIENSEEYALHDYEGFGNYRLSEYQNIKDIQEIACFIEEYGELGVGLLNYYSDVEEANKIIEDNYIGCYESIADYAEELTSGTMEIPSNLVYYIDYEKMARDMELNGDIFTVQTSFSEFHIFLNA